MVAPESISLFGNWSDAKVIAGEILHNKKPLKSLGSSAILVGMPIPISVGDLVGASEL